MTAASMRSAAVASPSPNRNSIATLSTCAKGFALSYKPVHQQHDFIWLAPVLAKCLSPWHIEAYIKHRDHHNFPLTSLAPIAADMKYWVSITSLEAMGRLLMMMAETLSINRTWSKKKRNSTKETKETEAEKYLGEKMFANKLWFNTRCRLEY